MPEKPPRSSSPPLLLLHRSRATAVVRVSLKHRAERRRTPSHRRPLPHRIGRSTLRPPSAADTGKLAAIASLFRSVDLGFTAAAAITASFKLSVQNGSTVDYPGPLFTPVAGVM